MYHFFIQEKQHVDEAIYLEGPDVNHIKNVLRMKTGEKISLTNEDGVGYTCSISKFEEGSIVLDIIETFEVSHELPAKITLFQGLPKGDKFETIIQKSVELGVFEIIPVETKRCVVKLDEKKKQNKIKRWNAISESAAKQSKRTYIPQIKDVMTFDNAIETADEYDLICIPYENAEGMSATRDFLDKLSADMKVAFFIGPEGGFEEGEIEKAISAGITPVSLGKRVLRTETASMALLSMIMLTYECNMENSIEE